ncbi:MAG TPA: NAD(P)/FAD-dependent oxidoreductase [Blastocatellia bacterium]|nr:NAD(P)/FAD-dependent oxidoreductase [Blastocatellia bacterium]
MNQQTGSVAIIGGGLAGLTAANYLARAGKRVMLFEKSHVVGGRAVTDENQGFRFNLGPHALYRNGSGVRILRELGVEFSGSIVGTSGAYAFARGEKHTLPAGFVSLLTTGLMPLAARLELARLLGGISKINPEPLQRVTVREWLDREIRHPEVKELLQAVFRVATYTNAPELQSAGSAIHQLQLSLAGSVYYLNDGWQTLVDGLRATAEKSGAQIISGQRVAAVERGPQSFLIRTAEAIEYSASVVILALSPADAAALVKGEAQRVLNEWAAAAVPVRAACLDLGLKYLPQPQARFALGIDTPLYFSVHSAWAKLAPQDGAVIHVAKYLPPDSADDPKKIEQEMEALTDLMQPGWRDIVAARRFLPKMTVTNAIVTAAQGGLAGRPGPEVPGCEGLYVAGDWVGADGQLADASLSSAKRAAELVTQHENAYSVAAA